VLNNAIALAMICGVILSLSIFFFAPAFLSSFIGSSSSHTLFCAKQFAEIRALGTPAGIVMMVSQALCFGEKDAITPLKTVLISFVINLVVALTLVRVLASPIQAVAIATVAAQWSAAAYILLRIATLQRALEAVLTLLALLVQKYKY
jgi:Na+-driven multidrug efflux pump